MKVLVDKVPTKILECPFTDFDSEIGCTTCILTRGEICELQFDHPCNKLMDFSMFRRDMNKCVQMIRELRDEVEEE